MANVTWTDSRSLPRRTIRVIAILAVALAAGQLVQSLAGKHKEAPTQAALKAPVNIVQLSAAPRDAKPPVPRLDYSAHTAPAPQPVVKAPAIANCAPHLNLREMPGVVMAVNMQAPCDGGARVVLDHAGLSLTERLPANGVLEVRLPVMDQAGAFSLTMADGRQVAAALVVPDMADVHRFAVQWAGIEGFVLHGLENGAEFGQRGDVSPQQPGVIPTGGDQNGWMSQLGDASVDNPLLAQIYTYPDDGSTPNVVVEAPVTASTCGKTLQGQTVQSSAGLAESKDLALSMPDCSAIGDFLVLKNLAQDVKVASR